MVEGDSATAQAGGADLLMDLQAVQFAMAGIDIPAFFSGSRADMDWALQQIDNLPDAVWPPLFRDYLRRRKAGPAHNAREANTWLRERVSWFRAILAEFPVRLHEINTDDRRVAVAVDWANQTAQLLNNATDGQTKPVDARDLFDLVSGPAAQWGFVPQMPNFQSADRQEMWIAAILARMLDQKWWTRKITRAYDRYTEHAAIISGKVRKGVSAYLSHANLKIYRQRRAAAMRWAQEMLVVNEEHGLEISLAEAIASSVANPEIRRHELMTRMRGFEDIAAERGHVGVFITWTAPSRFHPWKTRTDGKAVENKRYQNASPRDTQAFLSSLWTKARAKLNRAGIAPYGFRVVEPHHDGTPHWHMMLFCPAEHCHAMLGIIQRYAISWDQKELVRTRTKRGRPCPAYTDITPRFDWQLMNPAEGGATGYMAKYIAKNVDGHRVGEDFEAEDMADKTAIAACGWASWHGIRQFQQIGGPGVGVWRELRRLSEMPGPPQDLHIELCRKMADTPDWAGYVNAMGGPILPRAQRPVMLLKEIEEAASRYGEDVARIMGVMGHRASITTRLQGWEITRHGLDDRQAVAARQGGAVALPGRGAAPWSSDNNCTEGSAKAEKGSLSEHANHLGLSDSSISRVLNGGVVTMDGRYVWHSMGQLVVSRHHPTATPPDDIAEMDMLADKRQAERDSVVAMRRSIWQQIETGKDIGAWLASRPDDEIEMATAQMEDIISQLEQERYIEKLVEQRGSRYAL